MVPGVLDFAPTTTLVQRAPRLINIFLEVGLSSRTELSSQRLIRKIISHWGKLGLDLLPSRQSGPDGKSLSVRQLWYQYNTTSPISISHKNQ